MASQTQNGWRRDQMATADLVQQANRIGPQSGEAFLVDRVVTNQLAA